MNKNIIEAIVERGGNDGWDTTEDAMKKSFTFDSFEQAQNFCYRVSQWANTKDHHPEWNLSNKGCTVNVNLTSHFAGNKVTRLDFELAEEMNKQAKTVSKRFSMFPRIDSSQMASIQIGLLLLACGGFVYKVVTYNPYHTRQQRMDLMESLPAELVKVTNLETQAQANNVPVAVARYNQAQYYDSKSKDAPISGM